MEFAKILCVLVTMVLFEINSCKSSTVEPFTESSSARVDSENSYVYGKIVNSSSVRHESNIYDNFRLIDEELRVDHRKDNLTTEVHKRKQLIVLTQMPYENEISTIPPSTSPLSRSPRSPRFAPITLGNYNPVWIRLTALIIACIICNLFNLYALLSFFLEPQIREKRFSYQGCAAFCDFFLTATVYPTSAVAILIGRSYHLPTCKYMHFSVDACSCAYSMFLSMACLEAYYRLCRPAKDYRRFMKYRVEIMSVFIFGLSFFLSMCGVWLNYSYDYCQRLSDGHFYFQLFSGWFIYVVPCGIASLCLLVTFNRIHFSSNRHLNINDFPLNYEIDCPLNIINMVSMVMFLSGWIPYAIVVQYPHISDFTFYACTWMLVIRPSISSFIYLICKTFRRSFVYQLRYCFYKSSLAGPHNRRRRNGPVPEIQVPPDVSDDIEQGNLSIASIDVEQQRVLVARTPVNVHQSRVVVARTPVNVHQQRIQIIEETIGM